MAAVLGRILGAYGVTQPVIGAVLYMVLKGSLPTPGTPGPAVQSSMSMETAFRAAYLVNAAVRIQNAINDGALLDSAMADESSNLALHNAAQLNRRNAAVQVDRVHDNGIAGWSAILDDKTSPECAAADGSNFRIDQPPSIGYPGAVHPHCFPAGTVVSGPDAVGSTSRWYDGELVEAEFGSGAVLTVTPNHPVLTTQGWVAAGLLVEGSQCVRQLRPERPIPGHPDHNQEPALIEDVARSFGGSLPVSTVRVPVSSEDFHGDGEGSQVAVVRANGPLRHDGYSSILQPSSEDDFTVGAERGALLAADRQPAKVLVGVGLSSPALVGGGGESAALLGRSLARQQPIGFELPTPLYTEPSERTIDGATTDAIALAERLLRFTAEIAIDQIRSVRRYPARCHVHNLQTRTGWYVADGILVHNCRCLAVAPYPGAGWVQDALRALSREQLVH